MMVRIVDVDELPEALEGLPDRISEAAWAALGLEEAVPIAKALCPVDTGALAGSIRVERTGPLGSALVAGGSEYTNPRTGRPVDYAAVVHEGTSGRPARPFLRQALLIEASGIARVMLEGVEP
jgi:hypothetical protein